ncbi:MAG: hypothetical protein A2033_19385, partial [Bacteroidetes bacterium GWA2_31_9]
MKKLFTLITFVTLSNLFVNAQIAISDGQTISENFSIGTATSATLPAVWKVDSIGTIRTVGLYSNAVTSTWRRAGNNMSATAFNGVYNYGAGDATTATDRAVGFLSSTSSTKSGNLYVMLNNNGVSNLTGFTINYNVEKYRYGSNNFGFSIQLYYSFDGINWTSAGTDFLTSFIPDADSEGFANAPGFTVPVSAQLNVLVNAGNDIYLAWNYSVSGIGNTTASAQGLGIDDVSITATSVICETPTTQACNINFTNMSAYTMDVNWTNGNGMRRLVVMNTVNTFTNPVNGTEYTANSVYGGSGEQVIYKGTGTTVSISGLSANSQYYFKVFEINCYSSSSMYNVIDTVANPVSQISANYCTTPTSQATNMTFSALSANSIKVNFTNGDADFRIVVVRQGFSVTSTPTNGVTYNANSYFGLGNTIAPNEFVVYKGSGSSTSVYGLQPNTTYYFAVFEYCTSSGDGSEIYLSPALSGSQSTTSSTPSSCFEIESILVDACARAWNFPHIPSIDYEEGPNEMVRFVVGNNSVNTADMTVDWPNNAWKGICQNVTTAEIVQRLNNTIPIESCGKLLEPPGGVIPSKSNVLLITSSDTLLNDTSYFDILGNTFETLTDTLYAIFQCSNPNNRDGHFGNYDDSSQVRTLRISFSSPAGCSDTVRYNKSFLVNQNGLTTLSNQDGSRVDFAWDGTATYGNQGCQAPFVPLEVTTFSGSGNNSCQYEDIQLAASISGTFIEVFWTGGAGTFSSASSINTTYTPDSSETGIVALALSCVSDCNDTVTSIININIYAEPIPIITATPDVNICEGKSLTLTATDNAVSGATYNWNTGETTSAITFIPTTGTYTVTATSNGCTASESIDIVVNTNPTVFLGNDTAICQGESLTLDAGSGFTYNWLPGNITTQTLNVNLADNYFVTITDGNGCTATDAITLTVNQNPSPSITGLLSYCDGANTTLDAGSYDSYIWSNSESTQTIIATAANNPITVTVTDANNCIGVSSNVNLTINYPTTSTTTITECESYLWTDGNTYTISGNYSQTLAGALGCDSIANLDLTINYATTSTTSITDCDSYLWTDGNTYTTSGNYSQTLVGALGCDSIANLDLIINYASNSTTLITNCDSYLWTDGNTYTSSGNYSQTLVNALGCDSIANLNLTINYASTSTTSITACDSYLWTDGNTYTTSGNYSQTLVSDLGCDSIANLDLTINYASNSTTTITECESYLWTDGNTYTSSGNYSQTLVNALGCDSIANLNLTINYASTSTTSITACDSYLWTDGNTYTTSGNYSQTLVNDLGCDSVA